MVGEDDRHCETLSARGIGAVKLNTTLISIEAAVCSRPITQSEDSAALTPAHFLIGEGLVTIPTGTEPTLRQNLTKELRLKQKTDDF